jgi:hypothetical protein
MGFLWFGKKPDTLDQANLDCIAINGYKIEFIIDSVDSEKYCALFDLLYFLQSIFQSHITVFTKKTKAVKKIVAQAKKKKHVRKYSYLKNISTGNVKRENTEFYPLSLFLSLFNVALLTATEVEFLHTLLLERLGVTTCLPAAATPSTAEQKNTEEQKKTDMETKKDVMENKEISITTTETPVEPFTEVCTPKHPSTAPPHMLADTLKLESFSDSVFSFDNSSSVSSVKKADKKKSKRREKKKRKKLKEAMAKLKLKALEDNYLRINQQFEAVIAQNQALLVSPRPPDSTDPPPDTGPGNGSGSDLVPASGSGSGPSTTPAEGTAITHDSRGDLLVQQHYQSLSDLKQKRKANKKRMLDILASGDTMTFAMPRWRHALAGVSHPPPGEVLGGKRLFRVVARIVLLFFVKPMMSVRRQRLEAKDAEREEFLKSTRLFFDICSSWVGMKMRIPLLSILQVSAFCRLN